MKNDKEVIEEYKIKIKKYEKKPEYMKLNDEYKELVSDIDKSYNKILENINKVDRPDDYVGTLQDVNDNDNDKRFDMFMERINVIRNEILNNDNNNLDTNVDLYLELHKLVKYCKDYLNKGKIELIYC